jgi:hypothetical protein
LAGAVAAGVLAVGSPPASASNGTLTFTNLTSLTTQFTARTSGACPSGSTAVASRVSGGTIPAGSYAITKGNTPVAQVNALAGPFSVASQYTLEVAAANAGVGPLGDGTYSIEVLCYVGLNAIPSAVFEGQFRVTGQVVTPVQSASTSMALSFSPASSTVGQAVNITATVSNLDNPGETPLGAVQFQVDGADVGTPVTMSGGAAVLTTSSLPEGTLGIAATYQPSSASFTSSSAGPASFTVGPAEPDTTEVTLTTTPAGAATWGQSVTLTATVANLDDPVTKPTGTVQFVNGAGDLGSPVALVNGVATRTTSILPVGVNSLTAYYDPGPGLFVADTSAAVDLAVSIPAPELVRPATLGGVARVGSALVCNPGAWLYATQYTYSILRNGVAVQTSTADNDRVLAASDLNYLYSCRITATNPTGSTVTTTAAAKVVAGPASVATVKPRILGTPAVGKKLTATRGTWSPAATTYIFTWKVGTKVLKSGATATTYLVPATLRGKIITLTVTAKRVGYLDGRAVSAGVRIR